MPFVISCILYVTVMEGSTIKSRNYFGLLLLAVCVSERNRQLESVLLVLSAAKNWTSRSRPASYPSRSQEKEVHGTSPITLSQYIISGFVPSLWCVSCPEILQLWSTQAFQSQEYRSGLLTAPCGPSTVSPCPFCPELAHLQSVTFSPCLHVCDSENMHHTGI